MSGVSRWCGRRGLLTQSAQAPSIRSFSRWSRGRVLPPRRDQGHPRLCTRAPSRPEISRADSPDASAKLADGGPLSTPPICLLDRAVNDGASQLQLSAFSQVRGPFATVDNSPADRIFGRIRASSYPTRRHPWPRTKSPSSSPHGTCSTAT
jgi:hypothetical protein